MHQPKNCAGGNIKVQKATALVAVLDCQFEADTHQINSVDQKHG
jgi:hypothetical protein